MVIGGYSIEWQNDGLHGVTVKHHESGWSFFLQGDAAEIFKCEWRIYHLKVGDNFEDFLYSHDYNLLFQ